MYANLAILGKIGNLWHKRTDRNQNPVRMRIITSMARFPSTIVMLALCVLVSACASEKPQVTRIPNAEGGGITIFETGGGTTDVGPAAVFSDDSSAHLVGRNILTKGGSAIDAVVGMVMASSVSAPHVAGLGAGGQCLVYRADDHRAYAIDFVRHDGGTQRPELLPAMLTLHANFGRLPWGEVSASAQHLARFGAPISKELHTALSQHQDRLLQDAMMRKLYFSDNKPLRIGTFVT
ncbi:MAG: gamma-glutamyltransferase, partial [Pseudomonadota bacterium]